MRIISTLNNYYNKSSDIDSSIKNQCHFSSKGVKINNPNIWGNYGNTNIIRYNCITVNDPIPLELKEEALSKADLFYIDDSNVYARYTGRYQFQIQNKDWILDVVFLITPGISWTNQEIEEYYFGQYGYTNEWTYDLDNASMRQIIMIWIEEIPREKRSLTRVVRHLMSCMNDKNRPDALLQGKWANNSTEYQDGTHPCHWSNSGEIYDQRLIKGKAIKYGQCFCFSECLTSALRFLRIPTRTIYGTNSHIDVNKRYSIDLDYSILSKGPNSPQYFSIFKEETLDSLIEHTLNETVPKSDDLLDNLRILGTDDSVWNFHYWNEIYIDRKECQHNYKGYEWQVIDSTPVLPSDSEDEYRNHYVLGPCNILAIQRGIHSNFDFKFLHSATNSSFRIWSFKEIEEQNQIKRIPVAISILYPHFQDLSHYLNLREIERILHKRSKITTRQVGRKLTVPLDISSRYYCENSQTLYKLHRKEHPIIINPHNKGFKWYNTDYPGPYYFQQVFLDENGDMISYQRTRVDDLKDHKLIKKAPEGTHLTSFLIVHLVTRKWWVEICPMN